MNEPRTVRTWDLPVRVFHWLLVAGLAAAAWTAGDARWLHLHVVAGTATAGLVLLRLLWGLVGPAPARLSAMAAPWSVVKAHARGILDGTAPRFQGHEPVAGWAMLALLGLVLAVGLTGALVLGGEEQQGLLAPLVSIPQGLALHEAHEVLAWGIAGWLGLHLVGMAKASLHHRENLPLSMVTGRKRAEAGAADVPRRGGLALAVVLAVGGGVAWATRGERAATPEAPYLPYTGPALADDPTWRAECGDCHLALHPSLLPARSWLAMMRGAQDHFGEDLALDPDTAGRIEAFLVAHAAEAGATETAWRVWRTRPADQAPQRITETAVWLDVHADIPDAVFDREPVKSRLRCQACHADAEVGTYADGAMRLPAVHPRAPEEET